MSFAGVQSRENKKQWAPPDFERQTTKGNDMRRIFSISSVWSKGYWSTSIQPHLQLLSRLIGMMPIAAPLPERCPSHVSMVRGSRTTAALPVFFPFAFFESILYVPYASSRPSKMPANFFTSDIYYSNSKGGTGCRLWVLKRY